MPTYQYECERCGHLFEVMQSITDARLTDCPSCQAKGSVHRLIGKGAGIIFKGTGFYETDYKNRSCPDAGQCPSSPENSGGCGCQGSCGHSS